jgi:hypothetical protein
MDTCDAVLVVRVMRVVRRPGVIVVDGIEVGPTFGG